jgi:hypothetical protein
VPDGTGIRLPATGLTTSRNILAAGFAIFLAVKHCPAAAIVIYIFISFRGTYPLVMPVNSSFLHAASKKQPATKRVLEISFNLSRIVLAFNISIYKYALYAKAQVSTFH